MADLFNNHAHWASHMVEECVIKKNKHPASKFKDFQSYNDSFYAQCAVRLEQRANDLSLHDTMVLLLNGNITHLKRDAQIRIMFEFVLKGVKAVERERKKGFLDDFEARSWQYWQIARRYCHDHS